MLDYNQYSSNQNRIISDPSTAFQFQFSLLSNKEEEALKKQMAENPRKFMFNVKYRTFMMEIEEGEFLAEVLPEEIKRGDGL